MRSEAGTPARSAFPWLALPLLVIGLLAAASPVLAHTPSGEDRLARALSSVAPPAGASAQDVGPAQGGAVTIASAEHGTATPAAWLTLAAPVQIDVLRCPAADGPPLAARPAAASHPHRPDAGRAPPAA